MLRDRKSFVLPDLRYYFRPASDQTRASSTWLLTFAKKSHRFSGKSRKTKSPKEGRKMKAAIIASHYHFELFDSSLGVGRHLVNFWKTLREKFSRQSSRGRKVSRSAEARFTFELFFCADKVRFDLIFEESFSVSVWKRWVF